MNLVRSAATVGGMTMASRVLGFVRDILIASALGTGPVADAFFVAFRFPNLFRRIFAEGAFNSAFVPLFAGRIEKEGASSARRFAGEAASALLWTLIVLSAICELAMPVLMYVIAPGFSDTPAKFDLAVWLTRLTFPYLTLMSLMALCAGILNALGRFTAAAAAPIVLNVVLIAVLYAIGRAGLAASERAGELLAIGVTGAGILQLAVVWIAARRAGFAPRLVRPRLTPGVRRLVVLGVPGVIAGSITQVNIMIGGIIASLRDGAVSYLYYADRIYQLPLGVVGVAIGVVLLPDLARRLNAGDEPGALSIQNRACEFAMLITVPAALALMVIAGPIIQVLFERGAFDAADTAATAPALAAFAAGLPAFVLIKVFQPGFFAREDTATPMWIALASVAVNVVGSLSMMLTIGHVGIAVATSLAGWLNAGLLAAILYRRGALKADPLLARRLALIALSAGVMAACLALAAGVMAPYMAAGAPLTLRIAALAGLVALGAAIYAGTAEATGAARLKDILRLLRRRRV